MYTCQLSRLWVENFDLTPAHACGLISHAWLKNVSCCRLAWHDFQKYVNSDPCKEQKPCVKWINDNTFLAISNFWREKHWEWARVYTRPKTGTGKCEGCFRFRHRQTSSEDFGLLWKTSEFFGNIRKWSCRFQKSQHSQDKNLTPIFQKKLTGIQVCFWMLNNGLKLNDDKNEFLIIGTSQQLGKLDNISIRVGDSDIHPVPIARNHVSWFDSRLSMATHITKICASSFYYIYDIRRIRHVRKYRTQQSTETLIHAFITSRLDYCNGLLYGLPDCLLNKLQWVQNACARLIFKEQKFCRVTPLIYELHWLPIKYGNRV